MKKTFSVIDAKKKPERQLDAIKFEIKKYLARERRKPLQENSGSWDFDCRVGKDELTAEVTHVGEINANITKMFESGLESFYVEILSKPKPQKNKPKAKEEK